jgi:myo-inositol-1(or 4)-monophosphatase
MPEEDAMYTAEEGAGAFRNGERIGVSSTDRLERCSMSFDSGIRRSPELTIPALKELGARVFNVRMFGASTVLLTYLAEGRLDFAVEFADQPWDFAAGACLVHEAGGTITAPDGTTLGVSSRSYIASNGHIHDTVLRILAAIDVIGPHGKEH